MAEPRWVIAMGACSSCGGVFNNYAVVQGVDKVVPVDIYIPGCPPNPDALLYAITRLQEKIRVGEAVPGGKVLTPAPREKVASPWKK